jgi:hypothetical protein
MPAMSGDPSQAITEFLDEDQTSRLTPAASNLTKAQMLSAMYSYANGGRLTEGLEKSDIQSIRAAFADRYSEVGVAAATAELGGSCCCCCTAVATAPRTIGSFSFAPLADVGVAFATSGPGAETEEGSSCCCCCCI